MKVWWIVFLLVLALPARSMITPDITLLTRPGKINEIPLLQNRFRIDHNVEKITLLFFRSPGSPAIVLVKPDGSKYYPTHAIKDKQLQWFDEVSYDLIIIEEPTPGPWQVIGQIQENSRIMVLGEIELEVESLPPLMFRGETLKISGRVTNDGKPIDVGYFRDVVTLYVEFVSTNNDAYANFGAGTQAVTEFRDDGVGFDERPLDGIFTGEFQLSFPAGEWIPEFYVETPMLKRRVVKDTLVIAEPPFKLDLLLAQEGELEHELTISIDESIVKPETLIFQGKILYPNGEEQMFTLGEQERLYRTLGIKNYDWGRYSVELSAFGTNINGREFMADLPQYKFEIERPIEKVPELEIAKPDPNDQVDLPPEEEPLSTAAIITIITMSNLLILLLGWLCIRIFVQKKPITFKISLPLGFLKKSKQPSETGDDTKSPESGSKNDKSGDILNLSMSDD